MLLFISNLYPLLISAELLPCLDISDSNCIEMNKFCNNIERLEYKIF